MLAMTTLLWVVLLPIIPAYLLFTALPGKAAVSGPLKGFRINLSGAFAGYFALVLLLISSLRILIPSPPLKWAVSGQVLDATTSQPLQLLDFTLNPPGRHQNGDGTFRVNFTTDLADDGKSLNYPTLEISSAGYKSEYVNLDPHSLRRSGGQAIVDGHLIKIGQIALTKQSAYIDPTTIVSSTSGTP